MSINVKSVSLLLISYAAVCLPAGHKEVRMKRSEEETKLLNFVQKIRFLYFLEDDGGAQRLVFAPPRRGCVRQLLCAAWIHGEVVVGVVVAGCWAFLVAAGPAHLRLFYIARIQRSDSAK